MNSAPSLQRGVAVDDQVFGEGLAHSRMVASNVKRSAT
jgi:hypothetical protein